MRFLFFILASLISLHLDAQYRCGVEIPPARLHEEYSLEKRISPTLPVVIHIVHLTDEENLSDDQIFSQIDILNRDFNSGNTEHYKVPEEFRDLVAIPGWTFCLAAEDPVGMPTSGIVRVRTSEVDIAHPGALERGLRKIKHSNLGGSDAWDTEKYINIWVGNTGEDLVIGDATFPGTAKPGEDGIVVDYRLFGGIGTSLSNVPFHLGKTLTHEMGHFFNLAHLSGNGDCDDDDGVDDTPNQSGEYFDCPSSAVFSCGSQDMVQNFMSLASDPCMLFFTSGQVARMESALSEYRSGLTEEPVKCYKPELTIDEIEDRFSVISSISTGQLIINLSGYTESQAVARLFDLSGRKVLEENLVGFQFYPIDTRHIPNGIYILELQLEGKRKAVKIVL